MVSTVNLLILWLSLTSTCLITLSAKEFGFTSLLSETTDAKELDFVSSDEKEQSDFISLSSESSDTKEFDLFVLALQWPGAICQTSKDSCCFPLSSGKRRPEIDFTIHGLWPMYKDGKYLDSCNGSLFDLTKVTDLKDKLETNWPSLGCPSKQSSRFWEYQWTKHGTCSESKFTQHAYFEAALNLKDEVDLLKTLESKSISPNGLEYKVTQIIEVIQKKIGYKPDLTCNRLPGWSYTALGQVYICVDKDGKKFMECPFPLKNIRCRGTTRFPCF